MNARVRRAHAADADAIARLCGELGYASTAVDVEVRRGAIAGSPEHELFVAELDGRVVGWLHACIAHAIEHDRCVEIRGLVVDEAVRSQSVGSTLLAAAERWARTHGVARVRVRSRDTRERAHGFYLREGYEVFKKQLVFMKTLDAE